MFCTSCGTRNSDDGNFCRQCGHKLDKPAGARITEAAYEKALPEDEQVASLLERAYTARKTGGREAAIALCMEALAVRPDSTACHSLLGQLHEQGGDIERAIAEYEQVLILNPGSIADRVKLDELRGEVPALFDAEAKPHIHSPLPVSVPRAVPHIVVADSSKAADLNRPPVDYRVPMYSMGAVGLVVLGAIAAMLMLQHQNGQHVAVPATNKGGAATQVASVQPGNGAQSPAPGQTGTQAPTNNTGPIANTNTDNPFSGLGSNTPVVIQQKAPADRVPQIIYQTIPAGSIPNGDNSLPNMPRAASNNSTRSDAGEPDIQNPGVHIAQMGGGTLGTPNNADKGNSGTVKATSVPPPPGPQNFVRPSSAGPADSGSSGSTSTEAVTNTGGASSNARKNMDRAETLALQGSYKAAGSLYIQALDGAGDDTAYVYRRAAWCFEKAGEKTTALNYYQHGIDEAQKLVKAGRQVENARSLIRACETGIKVCSN